MALWMWKKISLVVGFLAYFACCFFVFGPPFLYVNSKPAWYKPYWISNFSKCSLINENENAPLKQKRLKVNNAGFITKDMWKVIIEEIATNRPQNLGVTIGLLPYCFPGVSLRWMIFCYPPLSLKIIFVRFSFSPFCVKTTIPLLSFVSSWFISFFAKACFSLCKNIVKLYSLVRRLHSFGLYSHSGIKYFNSLIMNVFIKLL